MHPVRSALVVSVLGLTLASTGGCVIGALAAGAAAAVATIRYTENEAYRDFSEPLDATWKATLAALRDNGYQVSDSARPGVTEGSIESGDAEVEVAAMPGGFTQVRVRIGTFSTDDHRRRAALVLESVEKQLE